MVWLDETEAERELSTLNAHVEHLETVISALEYTIGELVDELTGDQDHEPKHRRERDRPAEWRCNPYAGQST